MHVIARLAGIGGAFALFIGLPGCGSGNGANNSAEALDSALVNGARANQDPALTAALQDQIMVDPSLSTQANGHSVRPADNPPQAPIPPLSEPGGTPPQVDSSGMLHAPAPRADATPAARARAQAPTPSGDGCDKGFRYGMGWANRLPAALPLYPGARVTEAAGNDDPACMLRVVSATVSAPTARLIDWYYTHAIRAGYSAEHELVAGDHVVAGTKGNLAYHVELSPADGGRTEVDIVANHGQ